LRGVGGVGGVCLDEGDGFPGACFRQVKGLQGCLRLEGSFRIKTSQQGLGEDEDTQKR
jgi:hypothetical protein